MNMQEYDELKSFFEKADIPKQLQLNPGVKMLDAPKTIETYLQNLPEKTPGLYTTEPILHRLRDIKLMIEAAKD